MESYSIVLPDYCENCPEFEVVTREESFTFEGFDINYFEDMKRTEIRRELSCAHRKRCANMVKWLEKNLKNKGENK